MSGEVELSIADQMTTIIKNYAVIFSKEFESLMKRASKNNEHLGLNS